MTTGLDERRHDHTRPTIAFIALAVAAAAVMAAGMTGNQPDTPLAADRPVSVAPADPGPTTPPPSPEPPAFPEFSMADVVTLAAQEIEDPVSSSRSRPRRPTAEPTSDGATSGEPTSDGATSGEPTSGGATSTPATGTGAGSGSRSGGGGGGSGTGSGSGTGGSDGSGDSGSGSDGSGDSGDSGDSGSGGAGSGGPGTGDAKDPGRGPSETGRERARGQQETAPGGGEPRAGRVGQRRALGWGG